MRRFTQTYLTVVALTIVLINLILVVAYTRQFALNAQATSNCSLAECGSNLGIVDLIVTNMLLVGLALLGFFVFHKIKEQHHQN